MWFAPGCTANPVPVAGARDGGRAGPAPVTAVGPGRRLRWAGRRRPAGAVRLRPSPLWIAAGAVIALAAVGPVVAPTVPAGPSWRPVALPLAAGRHTTVRAVATCGTSWYAVGGTTTAA